MADARRARVEETERRVFRERRRLDARVGARRVQQLAIEDSPARLVVAVLADVDADRRHLGRVRSRDRARRAASRLRDISPAPTSSISDTATCATTRPLRSRPRAAPRGEASSLMTETRSTRELCSAGTKPKMSALPHAAAAAKPITQAVDLDVEEQALRSGEPLGIADEERDAAIRQQHAEGRTGHRQHDVLDQQQANQPRPRRAQGEPHGDLATAGHAAHQHESRDVRAGDGEHQQAHHDQHDHRRQRVALAAGRRFPERRDSQPLRRIGDRPIDRQRRPDRVGLRRRRSPR